ncbi:recombinase family protein [Armatimonas sp.]|uniref:recombinase family protein n=1 Tax=Armatimonas sp. TaxID=1872638 RepID=UPI00286B73A9|nr:recombinase family protein [Armatimonas sp.]
MGTLIGYARTASRLQDSTQEDANLAKQRAALLAAGCDSVFEEFSSGMLTLADRTGLTQVLGNLQAGDTLVVYDVARLSNSLPGFAEIMSDLQKRDVKLRILSPARELTSLAQVLDRESHILNRPREFTGLDQGLDQISRDLDAVRRLDHSRRIKRGIALAKKAREQAA